MAAKVTLTGKENKYYYTTFKVPHSFTINNCTIIENTFTVLQAAFKK